MDMEAALLQALHDGLKRDGTYAVVACANVTSSVKPCSGGFCGSGLPRARRPASPKSEEKMSEASKPASP